MHASSHCSIAKWSRWDIFQPSSKVGDLRVLAQKSFQLGFLRLVAADHSFCGSSQVSASCRNWRWRPSDSYRRRSKASGNRATEQAFALFCPGGDRVVTWGAPRVGSDSSHVQDQLKSVQQVQATNGAFAAILADGSVVTWGNPSSGGDSSAFLAQCGWVETSRLIPMNWTPWVRGSPIWGNLYIS